MKHWIWFQFGFFIIYKTFGSLFSVLYFFSLHLNKLRSDYLIISCHIFLRHYHILKSTALYPNSICRYMLLHQNIVETVFMTVIVYLNHTNLSVHIGFYALERIIIIIRFLIKMIIKLKMTIK